MITKVYRYLFFSNTPKNSIMIGYYIFSILHRENYLFYFDNFLMHKDSLFKKKSQVIISI